MRLQREYITILILYLIDRRHALRYSSLIGLNPTTTLVVSQVVLSFVQHRQDVTLVMFTHRRDLMGSLVNKAITTWAALACSAVIASLNLWLLYSTFAPFFN